MNHDIIRYGAEEVQYFASKNEMIRKSAKGYQGNGAFVKMINESAMLVPDVNGLPEYVNLVWAAVIFGHTGHNIHERIICKEISKFISGNIYSMKRMAEASSGIRKY